MAVIVALRPALPGKERAAAEAILTEAAAPPVAPDVLSEGAVAALAGERLGREADPGFATACHRATRGNPLLVEELLAELAEHGIDPDASAAGRLEDVGTERIGRRVERRIAALPTGAGALADAVAVLGDGCDLDAAAALAELDEKAARRSASALVADDILADDAALRFRHPLVRAAVFDRLPAIEATAAHGRAARSLPAPMKGARSRCWRTVAPGPSRRRSRSTPSWPASAIHPPRTFPATTSRATRRRDDERLSLGGRSARRSRARRHDRRRRPAAGQGQAVRPA